MAKMKIKKFAVFPTSLTVATISAILGIIAGILILLLAGTVALSVPGAGPASLLAGAGPIAIIIIAVMYFIAGFISTALFCLIYNYIADKTGGIQFEVE